MKKNLEKYLDFFQITRVVLFLQRYATSKAIVMSVSLKNGGLWNTKNVLRLRRNMMIKDRRFEKRVRDLEKQVDYLSGIIVKEQMKNKDMQSNIQRLQADVDKLRKGANNG